MITTKIKIIKRFFRTINIVTLLCQIKNEEEISKFIAESIDQVKSGLPDDCELQGTFDFDVSLITNKEKMGKMILN